jgi:ABC-type Fe3+ transport system permease subunit/DNA-binding beta-propeller fold protein YncE
MRFALWLIVGIVCSLPLIAAVAGITAWPSVEQRWDVHGRTLLLATVASTLAGLLGLGPAVLCVRFPWLAWIVGWVGVSLLLVPEPASAYAMSEAWRRGNVPNFPELRAVSSLAIVLWPIPAAVVWLKLRQLDGDVLDAAALDGAAGRVAVRLLIFPWISSILLTCLLAGRAIVPYDLAAIVTTNVLARDAFARVGGDIALRTAAAIVTKLPLAAALAGLAMLGVWLMRARDEELGATTTLRPNRVVQVVALLLSLLLASALVTAAVVLLDLSSWRISTYFREFLPALRNGGFIAVTACAVSAVVALFAATHAPRWSMLLAVAALLAGGQIIALGLIRLLNASPDFVYEPLYDRPLYHAWPTTALLLWMPLVWARSTWHGRLRAIRDVAAVDGAGRWATTWRIIVPLAWPGLVAMLLVVAALAFAESAAAALIFPNTIANAMLTNVHTMAYGPMARAAVLSIVVAGLIAGLAASAWRMRRVLPIVLVGILVIGCDNARPQPEAVFGEVGIEPGQLQFPRAIAYSASDDAFWTIDKAARVQKFDAATGESLLVYDMPAKANGKPSGITIGPEGNVWIADTHYYRIHVISPEGVPLFNLGQQGFGPGEFIWPTDVAFRSSTELYVSEYGSGPTGGNKDRIQRFNLIDGQWTPTGVLGSFGTGPGQLRRPQSMVVVDDTLWVTDSSNHRIVAFDLREPTFGKVVQTIGSNASSELGSFRFPYGIEAVDDMLVVAEFGNNRLQKIDPITGRSFGTWGEFGSRSGQFRYAWAVAHDGVRDRLLVADGGNNRVQAVRW